MPQDVPLGESWSRPAKALRSCSAQIRGGMHPDQVIFTSGGTEANNLALLGLAGSEACRIVVSAIEHPSVMLVAKELSHRGCKVDYLGVDARGVIDLNRAHELIHKSPRPRLVSVMLANNETGVLQPLSELAELCRQAEVLCHVDAVQGIGSVPINFHALGITSLAITAHKFYGPLGIGALVIRSGAKLDPQLFGGFQQGGVRPGTESVPLAVALSAALRLACDNLKQGACDTIALRELFESQLQLRLPEVVVNGAGASAPHTFRTLRF